MEAKTSRDSNNNSEDVCYTGVLPEVKYYYNNLSDSSAGLLQTAFVISYMLTAPLFGYMGDRMSRKMIIIGGIIFWSITTLLGSFVPPNYFWLFLLLRALVGVGEASYSTIAPTIIADLFSGTHRSVILALFYFAIPVGSENETAVNMHRNLVSVYGEGSVAAVRNVVEADRRVTIDENNDSTASWNRNWMLFDWNNHVQML
ncbi:SPNS3 [Cordylochernes scorpioides]|uniref:SPNS3 n=1 Tax=Cordylochernes scorpioides TaxID=51811 RepID=A0ABY6KAF1_9ARAC|nr:SPNS3 [Cordylochernes scorpioides]